MQAARDAVSLARLYGKKLGHGSLAVVTEGFETELRRSGLLKGVYAVDQAASYADGEAPTEGADARYGIFVGPLACVGQMFEQGHHKEHFVMVTPNSDQLPQSLVKQLIGYQKKHQVTFMAPSAWAARVVEQFLTEEYCLVVPHGVSPEYMPLPDCADEARELYLHEGQFRAIHFSTSDRQRKGTIELLKGWGLLEGQLAARNSLLLCVMDYPAKAALEEAIADGEVPDWAKIKETVRITDRAELPPASMCRTLCRSHISVQPSRGEGFGLIPLQALCSGVPIVATTATGHSEYLGYPCTSRQGMVLIRTGDEAPIDDLPGSRAPSVSPWEIASALGFARAEWPRLHAQAQANAHIWRSNWSWEASLESFVKLLKQP